jgi:hypothetical protein
MDVTGRKIGAEREIEQDSVPRNWKIIHTLRSRSDEWEIPTYHTTHNIVNVYFLHFLPLSCTSQNAVVCI